MTAKTLLLLFLTAAALCPELPAAETLDTWLLERVQNDEQVLADALSQRGGRSMELLRDARTYVPFFLEKPRNDVSASEESMKMFEAWVKEYSTRLLPGGYVFRLRFGNGALLYATSGGDWDGTVWRSLSLGKDLVVEPKQVWNGSGKDELLATLKAGVPPRLFVYDQEGRVKREVAFDMKSADFEKEVAAAEKAHAVHGAAILELLSLSEYLENPDALWRKVDCSGKFNLRNQHERDTERKTLEPRAPLNRAKAVEILEARS